MDEGYIFPREDDDLADYNGGNVHLMVPGDLLQDISKQYYIPNTLELKWDCCYHLDDLVK